MHKQHGFTIVELLIVIVVIAILAAISVTAYNGMQSRATDTSLRQAAATIEKSLKIWAVDNGSVLTGDSGSTLALSNGKCPDGGGQGFIGRGLYTCTMQEYLEAAKLIPTNYIDTVPLNTYYGSASNGRYSIMVYQCSNAGVGKHALYWTLRAPTAEDASILNSTISTCSNPTNIRDTWGMRSARIIQL